MASKIAYNGTQYVAGLENGATSNTFCYSPDGKTWTSSGTSGEASFSINDFGWNGSLWIGIAHNLQAYSSSNGSTWTGVSGVQSQFDNRAYSVVWVGTKWIISGAGQGQNRMISSTDGTTWSGQFYNWSGGSGNNITTFMKWNGSILLVGFSATAGLSYSNSPYTTFTQTATSIFTTSCNGIAWNGTRWVAVGQGTNTIAHSTDGINWTPVAPSPFSSTGTNVSWNGAAFVASGTGGNTLAYSENGINWTGAGSSVFSSVKSISGAYVWPF